MATSPPSSRGSSAVLRSEEQDFAVEAERDKNRKMLRDLYEQFAQFRAASTGRMDRLSAENSQLTAELAQSRSECGQIANELTRTRAEYRGVVSDSVGRLNGRSEQLTSELNHVREIVRSQIGGVSQQSSELRGELNLVRTECSSLKRELQDAKEQKSKLQQQQKEIEQLKIGIRSTNEVTRLEAKSDLAAMEIHNLRRQLWERGVLFPTRIEKEPEAATEKEEERPPVGTLELSEDIFSARLLLRLGLMKHQQETDAGSGRDDESLLSDCGEGLLSSSNVLGLVVPEVEDGPRGHSKLVYGWGAVCSSTFAVQTIVLLIMLGQGLDIGSNECFEKPPPFKTWLLLHTSKALAMLVAGTLMGKELMDIANYWMVAELLMPSRCLEVTFTALLRVAMTITLIGANIAIFLGLTNPAEVWLNMTALAFISSLGSDVLDVAKRGVFGHQISKTVTTLNFQLTFVSEYPHWFGFVRSLTIAVMAAVVVSFALITFTSGDPMCK